MIVLDSLPFGGDMDDTLPTDINPGDWIHTAPMQELLAKGDAATAPSSKAPLRTAKPLAAEEDAKDGFDGVIETSLNLLTGYNKLPGSKSPV